MDLININEEGEIINSQTKHFSTSILQALEVIAANKKIKKMKQRQSEMAFYKSLAEQKSIFAGLDLFGNAKDIDIERNHVSINKLSSSASSMTVPQPLSTSSLSPSPSSSISSLTTDSNMRSPIPRPSGKFNSR